ncbi:MAG: hypothetical protein U0031_20995 [Thermomicrobiales bacterium]
MIEQQLPVRRTFAGSKAEQEFAEQVLGLLLARGMFMSANAPIRVSVPSIAEFLTKQGLQDAESKLESVIRANPEVFAIDEIGGERFLMTTRDGSAPRIERPASEHTFATRFLKPLPKPERAASRPRPQPQVPIVDAVSVIEIAVPEPIVEVPEPVVAKAPETAPEPVVETPAARTITTQAAKPTDVTDVDDLNLAVVIRERLGADPRVANFGEQWMMEDRVPRFSRGDLRRLRDYMQEKEQPITDDDLAQDVLGVRPGSPELDLTRFAVNFRLSTEHRDFEFVGTGNQRFWSTSGLPQIGTTRRKLNELGTDYRYLVDEAGPSPEYRSRTSVDHTLTFYEYIHGLLPYDSEMQELLPAPLLPSQKSAVLTFECPQSFTTYLVELRYPTPNRGGFILGLDDFYTENLVPGAVIAIQRTDNDGHYRVEYLSERAKSEQLLELDERRAQQRYVFRPTTYACGVDDTMLLTESRFGGLANEKPLEEKLRRRPEAVVAATFERIGDRREGNFSLPFDTLLAGVNIERPVSAALLRSILDHDDTGAFSRDPDAQDSYTYVPGTTP